MKKTGILLIGLLMVTACDNTTSVEEMKGNPDKLKEIISICGMKPATEMLRDETCKNAVAAKQQLARERIKQRINAVKEANGHKTN